MLGLVLATDAGLVHVAPGGGATLALTGPRFTTLDYRDGIAIAGAPGHGVWMHRGGQWARAWDGDPVAVRVAPDGRCYIAAAPPSLYRSADGGETWAEIEGVRNMLRHHLSRGSGERRGQARVAGIVFPAGDLLLAVRPVGTWLSQDDGRLWMRGEQLQLSARSEPLQAEELDPHINGLWAHPEQHDRLYATVRSGIFRSDDGGYTWDRSYAGLDRAVGGGLAVLPGAADTLLLAVARTNPERADPDATLAPDNAALFRSTNGGARWTRVTIGDEDAWRRWPLVSAVAGSAGMLFVKAGPRAWASHDRGAHWLPIADDLPEAHAMVVDL
jgi:photosystem II stability/assembly factor-like uncharacterized protein